MTLEEKLKVIEWLNRRDAKLVNAELRLLEAAILNNEPELEEAAKELAKSHKKIQRLIDFLRGKAADQWTAGAADIQAELDMATRRVTDQVRKIQRKIEIANNVVKLVAQVDDFVATVKNLVG